MFWRKPCGAAVKDSTLVCFVHVWSAQHQRHSPLYQLPSNWSNIRTMRQLQPCRLSVKNGLMNTTKLSTAQGHVGQLALSVFSQASTKTGCLQTGCSYRLAVQRSAATFAILTHLRFSMVSCTWTMWGNSSSLSSILNPAGHFAISSICYSGKQSNRLEHIEI